jgi:hypothetical protein
MMSKSRHQFEALAGGGIKTSINKILKTGEGRGDFFAGKGVGSVWIEGGVGDFLDEGRRADMAMIIEGGDVQLFGDTSSPGCRAMPLAMVDFSFCERDSVGVLTLDLESWMGACRTIAMYAALAGIGRGIGRDEIATQCRKIQEIEPPGNHKP